MAPRLSKTEERTIDLAVKHFETSRHLFEKLALNVLNALLLDPELKKLIHSSKYRIKDASHLRDKLVRKALRAKGDGATPEITQSNLFEKVTDLAGVRLLHIHTSQFGMINQAIVRILADERYDVLEGPIANTWDDEYRRFFVDLGVTATSRESMYTSVHYIIGSQSRVPVVCELQVRTLMEEVWGEVSHTINYPHPTASIACDEQLKVLARMTSACTRLVDSIFKSKDEHDAGA